MGNREQTPKIKLAQRLEEGFLLWEEAGLPALTTQEKWGAAQLAARVYDGPHCLEFAAACQCFALFRLLHSRVQALPTASTLLGDYFFSQFAQNLIPLDSVPLIDAFAAYLEQDAAGHAAAYPDFLETLPAVIAC